MKNLLLATFAFLTISAQAQISSTFDTDADGWMFLTNGAPETVTHHASNGNPGGYLSVTYSSNVTIAAQGWSAPAKFLGYRAAQSYGMNLKFDLQQAFAGTNSSGQGDVRIETTTNDDIVFSLPVKPALAPAWSSYTIKLDETAGWRLLSTGGALATQADILRALSNVKTIEIRGTYITNAANVVGLDNVILEQKTLAVAPSITSFAPASGIPGTSLSLNGNNFGATAAQNVVYFGTTKATITTVTATRIDVTIPAGAEFGPITVINLTTGLAKQSSQSFSPVFDNNKDFGGRIIPSSFDLKDDIDLPLGSGGITGLDLGDLDGDGHVDIIATEIKSSPSAYQELLVFRNLGVTNDINATSFGSKIVLGQGANDCIVVDLDGDGKLDIIGTYSASFINYLITYRNISTSGNIAFEAGESFQNPSSAGDMHVADIDGDGRQDIMSTHPNVGLSYYFWTTQNLSVPGDIILGGGVFSDPVITSSREISTGDLTGDGKLEIIVSNGGAFRIFQNQSTPGTIALAPPVFIDPTFNVTAVELADLDNDGKLDLSWASGVAASAIRIRKNIYSGGVLDASSFDPEVVIPSPAFAPDHLTVADMNSDGKLDFVTTNVTGLGIFENTFSGTLNASSFGAPVQFQGSTFNTNPVQPIIADLDGDNKPDVVTATAGSTSNLQIFIFRNTCFPAPFINSVTPATGEAGTTLTLSGNFMNTGFDNPTVKLGSTPTPAGTVSNTSVTTSIPAGAPSDRVSVNLHGLTAFSKPLPVTFLTSRTIDASSFTTPIEFSLTTAFVDFTVGADNLTVADFDDDGKTDVVVNDNSAFRVFRNTISSAGSSISTASLTSIATTYAATARLASTDIDGDGKTDLIANNFIYRNNSGATADAISFEAQVQHVIAGTTGLAVNHDFNHDGKNDFAYTGGNLYQVKENASRKGSFTNFGGGPFSTIVHSSISAGAGGQPEKIIADDFDGDGYDDLAFGVNAGADFLSVVRNTGLDQPLGPGQFAPAVTFPALDQPWSIASADFDGDGKRDIVLGNNNAAFISIYRNASTAGSISFLAKQDIAALTRAIEIAAADLDGDGKPEIIAAHKPTSTTGSFTVFQNTSTPGTISFSAGINYPLTRGPLSLAIADINHDAKPDLIFTANGATTDALLVFENQITTGPVITISSQPSSTAVCDGATATLSVTASGAANLTYQWQKFDGSVFNNVVNGGGYTGATTSTLSINTTGNFGGGDYRVKISGDLATDKFSNTATLTVNVVPAAPITTGATNCIASALTLTATGGTNGQYRWYTVATNGTAISGQVNSTYTTPIINTTTTYYAAINNGFCESVRTAVEAKIEPLTKPTLTPSVQAVNGIINICAGDQLTITAPSGFTTYTWSNGASTNPVTITASTTALTLQVANGGCVSPLSDPLNVVVNPYPTATITLNSTLLTASAGDSYQWSINGVENAQATQQTLTLNVIENTSYTVDVTDNGCTSTSVEFIYLITGTETIHQGLKIYPNPFRNHFTIELPSEEQLNIKVIDALGRVVKNYSLSETSTLNLNELTTGPYTVIVQRGTRNDYYRLYKME